MNPSKRLCAVLLCLCMLVSLAVTPVYAANATSEGLAFTLNDDEQSYSVSLGTCRDTDVVIPPTYEGLPVTAIGVGAFAYSDLTRVTVPDSVTSIGNSAFENCVGLTRVTFGKNSPLKTVGDYAFFCCSSLMSVAVPDSVTEIGKWAFAYSGLMSVVIPDSVTSVGERTFYKCVSLMRVYYGGTDRGTWTTLSANANVPVGATVYYYSETQPTTMGNYWHYVDGVPTPWESVEYNVTVNCIGDIDYTVSGSVVTVDHEIACKVGYLSGGKYVAITATENGDGTYSFTAPEGVTEVLLVITGDANANGELDAGDCTRVKAGLLGKVALSPEAAFAGEANGTGEPDAGDCTRIKATLLGKTTLEW